MSRDKSFFSMVVLFLRRKVSLKFINCFRIIIDYIGFNDLIVAISACKTQNAVMGHTSLKMPSCKHFWQNSKAQKMDFTSTV